VIRLPYRFAYLMFLFRLPGFPTPPTQVSRFDYPSFLITSSTLMWLKG